MNSFHTGFTGSAGALVRAFADLCLFHPDYTVGFGISPKSACAPLPIGRFSQGRGLPALRRAGRGRITASEESHLALKQNPCAAL